MDPGSSEKIKEIISKIQFIPDLPLKFNEDLKFGHTEIAQTLKDIVLNANQSMTIGLFGSWGTGKSSIVHRVENLLEIEEKSVPTIIFDVWKHKDDALRRTFLFESIEQLKCKKKISDEKRITDSVSKIVESIEDKSKFDYRSLTIPFAIFCLFSAVLIFYYLITTIPPINYPQIFINSLLFGFIFAWVYWLPNNLNFIITKNTTRIVEDKFSDPAQFEKEFVSIIGWLTKDTKKLLIVFDNLDRVTEGKAVEVLTTIKTFLEPKLKNSEPNVSIIFLIPCDNEAIHKHIKNMYFFKSNNHNNSLNQKGRESEEFLNKFFNCKVTIPEFVPSEFEQFALLQLEKSGIPQFQIDTKNKNDVAWIIVQAYRNNPRRIIHFVNDLSGLYILLLHRVETGEFDLTFIDENLPQIAKYLVIEKKFPECLQVMKEEGYANPEHFVVKPNFKIEIGREFKQFIDATRDIVIQNIFLFSRMRLSVSEKKFPGIQHLYLLMENSEKEEFLKYLEQMNISTEFESDFSNALKDELEKKKIQQTKIQFIKSLFYIKEKTKISFSPALYTTIYNKIEEEYITLSEIPPLLVYESLIVPKTIPDRVNRIIENWISLMPNFQTEYLCDLLSLIFSEKIRIPDNINDKYFKNLNAIPIDDNIISIICNLDFKKQAFFLDPLFINKITNSKSFISIDHGISRINKISPTLITANEVAVINSGLKTYLNEEFFKTDLTIQKEFIDNLAQFIRLNANEYENLIQIGQRSYDEFSVFAIDLSRKIKSPSMSLSYLIEFSIISNKKGNPNIHSAIMSRINELLTSDPKILKDILNENLVEKLIITNKAHLDQLILQNVEFYVIIYSVLPKEKKSELLNSTFQTNDHNGILISSRLIQGGLDLSISHGTLENSIKKMIVNPAGYPTDQKQKLLEICNYTKCFENTTLIDLYIELLKKLLSEQDQTARSSFVTIFKKGTYVPEDRIRGLSKHLHNELANRTRPVQTDIIDLLLSINVQWTTEERNELMQVIFDKILHPSNIQEIRDLFEQLSQLKPQYLQRKQNFVDIKLKIEQEKDARVKTELIRGLLLLRPRSPTSNDTIEFWSLIEKYSKA